MCSIQFMKRYGENLELTEVSKFLDMMNIGNDCNSDAWGLFNSIYSIKASGSFKPNMIKTRKLFDSNFVIGHNRYATSGRCTIIPSPTQECYESPGDIINFYPKWMLVPNLALGFFYLIDKLLQDKNTSGKKLASKKSKKKEEPVYIPEKRIIPAVENHPFRIDNLIMVHNGVIFNHRELKDEFNIKDSRNIKTDSFVILWLIDYYMKKSKAVTREGRLTEGFEKAFKEIDGTYSLFLYDIQTRKVYYLKNFSTSFELYLINKSMLVGSTDWRIINDVFLEELNEYNQNNKRKKIDYSEIKIKNNTLYEITENPAKPIMPICKISQKKLLGTSWLFGSYKDKDDNVTTKKLEDKYIKTENSNISDKNSIKEKKESMGKRFLKLITMKGGEDK